MSLANPFVLTKSGIRFPDTLPEIDSLKQRMTDHVTRVAIEHAGLPDVIQLHTQLEQWRAEVSEMDSNERQAAL